MSAKSRKSRTVSAGPLKRSPVQASSIAPVVDPSGNPVPNLAPSGGEHVKDLPGFASLTPRQQVTLPVVALSPSIAQAARLSGVSESTLRRWLADPVFDQLVDRVRLDAARQAGQEIHSLVPRCLAVFSDAMNSPDLAKRLRAARYALSLVNRFGETETLFNDVQDLEAASQLSPRS